MSDQESTYNTTGLDELIKLISSNKCTAKLGILGDKNARTPEPGEKGFQQMQKLVQLTNLAVNYL